MDFSSVNDISDRKLGMLIEKTLMSFDIDIHIDCASDTDRAYTDIGKKFRENLIMEDRSK